MRTWLAFAGIAAAASFACAGEPLRVEGVRVYGRTQDVPISGLRQAIADFRADRPDKRKPEALEVLNSALMRAYLPDRDTGWISVRLLTQHELDGRVHPQWTAWGRAIEDSPEVWHPMSSAEQVYIFPVRFTEEKTASNGTLVTPHADRKHLRLLSGEARGKLMRIIGHEGNWFHGNDDTITLGDVPTNVGFVFRRGTSELVMLFTLGYRAECILPDGENLGGSLEVKDGEKMEEWKKRYGQPELAK